ncbi:MAG: WD40 repeat domain-containing protein [Candidatus Babeliales bacterium]
MKSKGIMFVGLLSCLFQAVTQAVIVGSNSVVSRQQIVVFPASDIDNEMRGFAAFEGGFKLENDVTSCTFTSVYPVGGTLVFNGGTLLLSEDMLVESTGDVGNVGTCQGNFHTLRFQGQDGALTLPTGNVTGTATLQLIDSKLLEATVNSVAWSYTNQYIAVAVNETPSNDEVKIYSFNGTNLTFVTSFNVADPAYSLRWHPSAYLLAVGRDNSGAGEIYTFTFNPGTGVLAYADSLNVKRNVRAVGWNPAGTRLAIAADRYPLNLSSFIRLYSVSGVGALAVLDTETLGNLREFGQNALEWDSTGGYVAVGVAAKFFGDDLYVLSVVGSNLAINASASIGAGVEALSWHPSKTWIAVGLNGTTERFRIYQHNGGAMTLTELMAARIGETATVFSMHWSPDGMRIVMGLTTGVQTEFRVYDVDQTTGALTLLAAIDAFGAIYDTRWSPNGMYIARGDTNKVAAVYQLGTGPIFVGQEFVAHNLNMTFDSDVFLEKNLRCQGTCMIDLQEHSVYLGEDVSIFVDANAHLHIKNGVIRNVHDTNLCCEDTTSLLTLEDMVIVLHNDYAFLEGAMHIQGTVLVQGGNIWVYASDQVSTIQADATLIIDRGTTFDYASSVNNAWTMADATASFVFHNAFFHSTAPGLVFLTGKLMIQGRCYFSNDATMASEAVFFGHNGEVLTIGSESGLFLTEGIFAYGTV